MRRAGEPSLLELAGHRKQALDELGSILACDGSAPGIRSAPAVREDAPRHDESGLVGRLQLRDRLEPFLPEQSRRHIELRLDVCLVGSWPDESLIALRTEQKSNRLGEDRLAGTGLPRHDVEPRGKLERCVADDHEVGDAKASEHGLRPGCRPRGTRRATG